MPKEGGYRGQEGPETDSFTRIALSA